jgi:hypothetical protein
MAPISIHHLLAELPHGLVAEHLDGFTDGVF